MYTYDILPEAREYVDGMPTAALAAYAELIGFLELIPWDAPAYRQDRPDATMRKILFGLAPRGSPSSSSSRSNTASSSSA